MSWWAAGAQGKADVATGLPLAVSWSGCWKGGWMCLVGDGGGHVGFWGAGATVLSVKHEAKNG